MNTKTCFAVTVLMFGLAGLVRASDWPRFHGLAGNGTSPETGLAKEWDEDGPPVLWSTEVGPGFGGVAVRDGEVYLLDRELGKADVMRCTDLETGEELWSHRYEAAGRLQFQGSRTVPTVEEEYVYTLGGFGHLTCFGRESHEPVWTVNLITELGGELPAFGYSQSPLVYEDLVVIAPLGEDTGVIALDRFTSDEVWRTGGMGSTHSSPVLVELYGEPQILIGTAPAQSRGAGRGPGGRSGGGAPATGPNQDGSQAGAGPQRPETTLTSLDPETGEVLWKAQVGSTVSIVAPLKIEESRFLLTGRNSKLVEVQKDGAGHQLKTIAEFDVGSSLHLPMLYGDHLYFIAEDDSNRGRRRGGEQRRERGPSGMLVCVNSSGNQKWNSKETARYGTGNVLLADGVLYVQDGYSGVLRVVEPSPDGYRQIAEVDLFGTSETASDQQAWAPMALSDGRLLIRTQDQLQCVDLRRS